jgi:hypothetical protein
MGVLTVDAQTGVAMMMVENADRSGMGVASLTGQWNVASLPPR